MFFHISKMSFIWHASDENLMLIDNIKSMYDSIFKERVVYYLFICITKDSDKIRLTFGDWCCHSCLACNRFITVI